MEVILNQDFPSLGYVGDRVKVRPGYARNFLIPRGVAIEATTRNGSQLRHRLMAINAKKAKLRAEAEDFAKRLGGLTLEFVVRIGAHGKAFGAVTAKDVESALAKEGVVLDRRQIKLGEPIKKAGEYSVSIKLHSEVSAQVAVRVSAEASEGHKSSSDSSKKGSGKKAGGKKAPVDASAEGEVSADEAKKSSGRKKRAKSAEDNEEGESVGKPPSTGKKKKSAEKSEPDSE